MRRVGDADLAALADVYVPDAWVVRDFRGAQRAEAAALGRRGGEGHLLGIEIARAAQGLRARRTEHRDDVPTLQLDGGRFGQSLARRIGFHRGTLGFDHDDIRHGDRGTEGKCSCCAPQHWLRSHHSSSLMKTQHAPSSAVRAAESDSGIALMVNYASLCTGSINPTLIL